MPADDDSALQPERTGLAWVRTLVVVAGVWALVAFHAVHDHGWVLLGVVAAVIAFTILVTCGWLGTWRGRRARQAMSAGAPIPVPGGLLALALLSVAAAVAALLPTLLAG